MHSAREIEELKQKIREEQEDLEQFRMEYRRALDFLARPIQTALYDRGAEKIQAQVREQDCEKALHRAEERLKRANEFARTSQAMIAEKKQGIAQTQAEIDGIQSQIWRLR